jgi:hypothetical protein
MEEVENQTRFREFNEWIEASNERMGNHRAVQEFICECSDAACRQSIVMTKAEYESIRAEGAQFVIALNHENPEIDYVLNQNERFAVSEKLPGPAQRRAIETDPRK